MPPKQDPAQPEFWETRYRDGFMPWDAGRVPDAVTRFLAAERAPLRVLVPGCGSAYEARAFAEAGHDVLAIDFSPAALAAAGQALGDWRGRLELADFFSFSARQPFDLIYERAFLCALPRSMWPSYAPRVAELLAPGGRLAGFFFWSDETRGPPFGLQSGELDALLGDFFRREVDEPVTDSIPIFVGRERWQVWRRQAP